MNYPFLDQFYFCICCTLYSVFDTRRPGFGNERQYLCFLTKRRELAKLEGSGCLTITSHIFVGTKVIFELQLLTSSHFGASLIDLVTSVFLQILFRFLGSHAVLW